MNNMTNSVEESKSLKQIALSNVTYYDDYKGFMNDRERFTIERYADEDECKQEFKELVDNGYIFDITCGTYNGATREFSPWELTDDNILDTISNALHEFEFCDTGYYRDCTEEEAKEFETWSNADWIREYTETYSVFIIGNNVYVSQD